MPSIFSRLKGKDGPTKIKSKKGAANTASQPAKPRWEDGYARNIVEPEEVRELVKLCTDELKARGLDIPFLLLPFRPTSDPSAVRTFIRHFFDSSANMRGDILLQELRMTEPMVISGVIKWCWSRLQGGVVGWDAYELFKIGEQDSNGARDSFKTFIPLSVENGARSSIIFDFFDLMSAIAAHGKANGFGGRKLSRMASWWTFEAKDTGNGFEGGYKEWLKAADATSHLFFAYLRQLAPEQGLSSFALLPMSLQKLLQETEYPPERPTLLMSSTNKVVMIVDTVSPTPFALLRRSSHFEYRDEDRALREFSDYEDPVQTLTDECRRVLKAISAANQTQAVSSIKHSTGLRDASWSRFEDIGFGSLLEEDDDSDEAQNFANRKNQGLRTSPASGANGLGRPTTPSWADFLSSGFVDDGSGTPSNMLLPPDKVLPPIDAQVRQRSSQSHRPRLETEHHLEPGELASISRFDLDDAFWWVWMSSLAPEETPERKSAFGRCSVIETRIRTGRWLVIEEIVKGAVAAPDPTAYIAEKKGFFSWTRRNKSVLRSKSARQPMDKGHGSNFLTGGTIGASKASIAADQQAKIQAAAQRLQARQKLDRDQDAASSASKRGRLDNKAAEKTASVFTLQPVIASEASPAMKWASKYDKETVRQAYLSNTNAGRGQASASTPNLLHATTTNGHKPSSAVDTATKPVPELPRTPQPTTSSTTPVVAAAASAAAKPSASKGDKAAEAPSSVHPAEQAPASKDNAKSTDAAHEAAASPAPPTDGSPDSKKAAKRLHKDGVKEKEKEEKPAPPPASGGFRKFFGRKNRQSKLPENAAADVNAMLAAAAAESRTESASKPTAPAPKAPAGKAAAAAPAPAAPAPVSKAAPVPPADSAPAKAAAPVPKKPLAEPPRTPTGPEPTYETSVNSVSPVGTAEAREADKEFARFDQGPLVEQPAFAGDSEAESDEAVPPPIARKRSPPVTPKVPKAPNPVAAAVAAIEEGKKAPPPVQDRWAKIRKNAADRAAQHQADEPTRGGYSKSTDADDDTSGEETIESRVARIKARVAELTGNMEGVSGPGVRR